MLYLLLKHEIFVRSSFAAQLTTGNKTMAQALNEGSGINQSAAFTGSTNNQSVSLTGKGENQSGLFTEQGESQSEAVLEVAFSLIAGSAFLLNLMFCVVLLKKRAMLRKPHNTLLFNLAITDLLTGRNCIHLSVVEVITVANDNRCKQANEPMGTRSPHILKHTFVFPIC